MLSCVSTYGQGSPSAMLAGSSRLSAGRLKLSKGALSSRLSAGRLKLSSILPVFELLLLLLAGNGTWGCSGKGRSSVLLLRGPIAGSLSNVDDSGAGSKGCDLEDGRGGVRGMPPFLNASSCPFHSSDGGVRGMPPPLNTSAFDSKRPVAGGCERVRDAACAGPRSRWPFPTRVPWDSDRTAGNFGGVRGRPFPPNASWMSGLGLDGSLCMGNGNEASAR